MIMIMIIIIMTILISTPTVMITIKIMLPIKLINYSPIVNLPFPQRATCSSRLSGSTRQLKSEIMIS